MPQEATMTQIDVDTRQREELVDVTDRVREAIGAEGVSEGWAVVFCPHTTAGVTINESADRDVAVDLLSGLRSMAPRGLHWRHREGNADAHIKATLTGSSVIVPVSDGGPVLGTWQGVFLCEYDGPRSRKLVVTAVGR
jgi:secondary thiamine-phosphate synthase enzyme